MVSLGSGCFDNESLISHDGKRVLSSARVIPIFQRTHVVQCCAAIGSTRTGSEAGDEALACVEDRGANSSIPSSVMGRSPKSSSDGKSLGPIVNNRLRNGSGASVSTGAVVSVEAHFSCSSSKSPPSIVTDHEHFPIFTDEDDCISIGESPSRAGDQFFTLSRISPISCFISNEGSSKDTSMLRSHAGKTDMTQEERGRKLARLLLEQARTKQAKKGRLSSFERAKRMNADIASSSSTSTSSSLESYYSKSEEGYPEHSQSQRHILSERSSARASLLRRSIQSLRRRKDILDQLFQLSPSFEEDLGRDGFVQRNKLFTAVTARNKAFVEWEKYLPAPQLVQRLKTSTRTLNNVTSPLSYNGGESACTTAYSPTRKTNSLSHASVTSTLSTLEAMTEQHLAVSMSANVNRTKKKPTCGDQRCLIPDALSGRCHRKVMLQQLGFLPQQTKKTNGNGRASSRISIEVVKEMLDSLDKLYSNHNCEDIPLGFSSYRRSPNIILSDLATSMPTVSLLGVTVINYPKMVCDQVAEFCRAILNKTDTFFADRIAAYGSNQ